MPQSENIRVKPAVNYRLTQYKKKNKLKNKSEAIDQLLANEQRHQQREIGHGTELASQSLRSENAEGTNATV